MSSSESRVRAVVALTFVVLAVSLAATAAARAPDRESTQIVAPRAGLADGHPLFANVVLTDEQRSRLESIRSKHLARAKAIHRSVRPTLEQVRKARGAGDLVKSQQLMAELEVKRDELRSLLDTERLEMRAVLTPAQQARFDSNLTSLKIREEQARAVRH